MARKDVIRRLFERVRPVRNRLLLAGVLTLLAAGADLALPWVAKYFVNSLLSEGGTRLSVLALAAASLFLISGLLSAIQSYLLSSASQRFVNNLFVEIYSCVQRLPMSFFDRQRVGELMSRILNDTMVIRQSVSGGWLQVITGVCTALGAVVFMFVLDWRLTLIVLAALPLIVLFADISGKWMFRATHRAQDSLADVTATMQEGLSGIRVVKNFAREAYESEQLAHRTESLYEASMRQAKIMAVLQPMVSAIIVLTIVGVLYYAARRVASGLLSLGDLVAFLLYVFMLAGSATGLTGFYAQLQEALAAAQRIFSLLDTEPEIADGPVVLHPGRVSGHVEFRQVRFSYNVGEEVVRGVQLSVNPGEVVALVGPSGAGKTTLVSLLLRFYEVDSGSILVDGVDVRDIELASLRSRIGLVAQEVMLFSGTIRENIRYGRLSATDEEVEAAARLANAHNFILDLGQGYDTLAGERGTKLSGGQCQRLTIARTLLSDPSILVLDEATRDLDAENEYLVREAMGRLMADRTVLVIAHRLSTVVNADRIVVLEAGEIAAQGTHEELLRTSNLYQRLYGRQFQRM
jgi:subfamily B ATP-binding cassette protein MsbA